MTHPRKVTMTPEEHYAYAVDLLKGCGDLFEVDTAGAAHQAAIAQAHFQAAAAATGMQALQHVTGGEIERLQASLSNALKCYDELQTAAGRKYEELRERLNNAEKVCALFGITAARSDTEREKAVGQAWSEWHQRWGASVERVAEEEVHRLATLRDAIRDETLTRIRGEASDG